MNDARPLGGLSSVEAGERLAREGPNELPSERRRSGLAVLGSILREPMLLLLLACGAVYLALGEASDAVLLLVAVVVVVAITVVQQRRTERALQSLRELAAPRALVIRDGLRVRVAARDVVAGDLIVLAEGERVPADGVLLEAHVLHADESLLSGESVPVAKLAGSGSHDEQRVFAGTLVTRGRGVARVETTGVRSRMGRIGVALGSIDEPPTPLQRESQRLVRRLGTVGLIVCLSVVALYGTLRGDWFNALLAGIALAMGLLPEEVPVVLTVFLAIGAWRMTQHRVLTRRLPSLEALGAATVLAVDKTGTLTENRMRVQWLAPAGDAPRAAGDSTPTTGERRLIDHALLATAPDSADPMERAIRDLGGAIAPFRDDGSLLREYPLSPQLMAMSRVWRSSTGGATLIAAKGAPEAVAALCHLDLAARNRWAAQVETLAQRGLRVLAVAAATTTHAARPVHGGAGIDDGQHDYEFEFLGLLGIADPLRASVPDALAQCRSAGVRVLMITGDHAVTAQAIARAAGFESTLVLNGADIDALDDAALGQRLRDASIVARAVPEHKLRIVRALQAHGDVVAMTGDGVNDAPALKAADIGVAMGARGTDVAREAADIVIADDDFGSIVRAVRMGRRLDTNLRRAMSFIIAVHVPLAGLALLPVLVGWPLLLLPAHIAFLELLIDPACSVVFELEPEDVRSMQRAPRALSEPLFSAGTFAGSALLGALVWALVAASAVWAHRQGWDEAAVRSLAFGLLVCADLALIGALLRPHQPLAALLRRSNQSWLVALVVTLGGLALLLGWPPLAHLFRVAPASAAQVLVTLGATFVLLVVLRAVARRVVPR